MKHLLDDEGRRRRIDRDDVLRAYALLPEQAREAWVSAPRVRLPELRGIRRLVVAGMGGSALGPHIVQSVYRDRLRVPMEIVNGYDLPGGIGRDTLVFLSSYSGTTEETLSAAEQARKRKAKLLGLCAGGPLAIFLKRNRLPVYVFDPRSNPGDRPRMALGYSVFGTLALLTAVGILPDVRREASRAIRALREGIRSFHPSVPFAKNPAKKMAVMLADRFPIYVGAEHLEGSVHAIANQTNETGKHLAAWFPIPELNHHLLEGLAHPRSTVRTLAVVFFPSSLSHPRIQKRFVLTREVVEKNGIRTAVFVSAAKQKLAQAAELLAFGGALTYYLGILHRENPSPNPWVDYFKRRLA